MSELLIYNLSQLDLPESFENYLKHQSNYNLLAAYAYEQYLQRGRGLLWLDWLNALKAKADEAQLVYITPNSAMGRSLLKDADPKVFEMINTYVPQLELLIRWQDATGIIRTRKLGGLLDVSPQNCYEHIGNRLCEFSRKIKL